MLDTAVADPSPCVLIVDDDDETRQRFVRALTREGLATIEASDGASALEEPVQSEPIALMLLDSGMPGMSGIDVIQHLRSDPRQVMLPVVMVTGAAEPSACIAGLEAGADDYVSKPVAITELIARVHTQLRRHHAWREASHSLNRWASVIDSLAKLPRRLGAEVSADCVCELLADEFPVVSVVAFSTGGASVLSARGGLTRVVNGQELDPATARRLSTLCGLGPWAGSAAGPDELAPFGRIACGVPLVGDGRLLGVMLIGSSTSSVATDSTLLSAAIGIGAVVAALLTPALAQRDSLRRHHDIRTRILEPGAFRTYFQPVVELVSEQTVGYEALTRWTDAVPPDIRLAVAREAGCGDELERAMIAGALGDAVGLPAGGWVSVNASAVLVMRDPTLAALLARADRDVVLELTEREPVDDYAALRDALAKLGEHVGLAIDDAGAGYAGLRHILALGPALVKLDREWIRGIDRDDSRQSLLVGLQHFATETGRSLIAEGIENARELETVRRLGIRYGQGYYLGRPAPLTPTGDEMPTLTQGR